MSEAETTQAVRGGYEEVDVTDWDVVGDEALGTKPKRWLRDPRDGHRWLLKDCTHSERSDGTRYRKGDDWSERIANGVAQCLGLAAARTELAVRGIGDSREHGVISKSVVKERDDGTIEEDLVDGNQRLLVPVVGGDRAGYTIESVRDALEGVEAPTDVDGGLRAWDVFVGYLVLDAVVGNTDRHEENWAVIARGDRYNLAPTFDHASCLGFQFHDNQRQDRLRTRDSGYSVEAYADRAKSPFAGKPHPVSVALRAMALVDDSVRNLWLGRCVDMDGLVEPVWMIPDNRMSRTAREFAERVLRRNCRRLLGESR